MSTKVLFSGRVFEQSIRRVNLAACSELVSCYTFVIAWSVVIEIAVVVLLFNL